MKLYHGTNELAVRAVLEGGIQPRGSRAGTWHGSSLADRVYLTTAYAPYFALWACMAPDFSMEKLRRGERQLRERLVVLEIDLARLDRGLLGPDEHFISETINAQKTEWRRVYMRTNWRESLAGLGTYAHFGVVPREAIARVAFFDYGSNPDILHLLPAEVSLDDHAVNGRFYQNLTRWFFEDAVTVEDLTGSYQARDSRLRAILERERSDIEKTMQRQHGLEVRDFQPLTLTEV
jgi:hypothetical protein